MLKELLDNILDRSAIDPNTVKLEHDQFNQPVLVLPEEQSIKDMSGYLKEPIRTKEKKYFQTVNSYIHYLNTFKQTNTQLFATPKFDDIRTFDFIIAVIDYHTPDTPHWCEHRAILELFITPQLEEWQRFEGDKFSQRDFIDHIKDNAADIANPDLATLIDALKKITINGKAAMNSSVNGHSESTNASASVDIKGVPDELELAIPMFYMSERYKIKVRLYVTGGEDGLTITYKMTNIKASLDMEYQAIVKKVADETCIELVY